MAPQRHAAREVAGGERDAEEDEDGARDLPDPDLEALRVEPEPVGEHREVEPAEQRVGDDLEDRVEDDEDRRTVVVAAREVVPDEDHRDAAREADDDHAGAVRRLVGEEDPGEREHQQRGDDPGQEERDGEEAAVPRVALAQVLVADLREDRVHHQQQAERDRQRHRPDLKAREQVVEAGDQRSEGQPTGHRQRDPQREEAVERREAAQDVGLVGGQRISWRGHCS